ncbi:MAG: hypothetical protein ABI876_12020, partial [Bacteroidota bacterium]
FSRISVQNIRLLSRRYLAGLRDVDGDYSSATCSRAENIVVITSAVMGGRNSPPRESDFIAQKSSLNVPHGVNGDSNKNVTSSN